MATRKDHFLQSSNLHNPIFRVGLTNGGTLGESLYSESSHANEYPNIDKSVYMNTMRSIGKIQMFLCHF